MVYCKTNMNLIQDPLCTICLRATLCAINWFCPVCVHAAASSGCVHTALQKQGQW